jgi:hypothetical protein
VLEVFDGDIAVLASVVGTKVLVIAVTMGLLIAACRAIL